MRLVTKIFELLILGLLILCSACNSEGEIFQNALCIQNISTIDPLLGLKKNQTVIIQDGKIIRISSASDLVLSPKNTIIDGSGQYLIPGLWDAHVHFAYLEELAPSMFDLFLAYGITSVRDTGGEINFVKGWKDKSIANPTTSPRVKIAGPLLDGRPNVYDGSDPGHPPLSVGLKSVEAVNQKIDELVGMEVDHLKAYEMLSPEQFRAAAQLSKSKNLKLTGHVPLSMDVISASRAGLNSMEHLRNLELSCASNADELLKIRQKMLAEGKNGNGAALRSRIHSAQRPIAFENFDEVKADKILDVLAQNNTWQIPTLTLGIGRVEKHFNEPDWIDSFEYLPPDISNYWKSSINEFEKVPVNPFFKVQAKWMIDMVGRIHDKGIKIMAGTDTPIFFLTPGLSLHQELYNLVQAGLSPLESLKTATYHPALYFDMENELGSIKEGYWADLLILSENPLDDIRNTQKINWVIKQGAVLDRQELLQGLKTH